MRERSKEAVGNGNDAHLVHFSEAFDCIDNSFLLAKLYGYGVSHASLKLIFSYFENRNQRTKMNN